MKRALKFPLKRDKGVRSVTRKDTTKEAFLAFRPFLDVAAIPSLRLSAVAGERG